MKIVLAGGETGGPIVPLIAIAKEIKVEHPKTQIVVLDTPNSVGKQLALKEKWNFYTISSGKLRRYWSIKNLWAPASFALAFMKAIRVMRSVKPNIVLGAGGYIQVPVTWAAWVCKVPVIIHQQDIVPSLSNTLCAPFASKITTTFQSSLKDFHSGTGLFGAIRKRKKSSEKLQWTGNPFRKDLTEATKDKAQKFFKLSGKLPVVLVLGGGTGARGLNKLVTEAMPELQKYVEVIHVTGKRSSNVMKYDNYRTYEFLDRIDLGYAAADLVVSRAGISTITELCNLKKLTILIPMPNSHQELNAFYLFEQGAAVPMDQETTTAEMLIQSIRGLLVDGNAQKVLKQGMANLMPKNSAAKIAKLVYEITGYDK